MLYIVQQRKVTTSLEKYPFFCYNRATKEANVAPEITLRGFTYNCVLATQATHLGSAWISALTCSTSGTVHQGQSSAMVR